MKKNTFIYFLSLAFCLMIAACSNKTSVKFFGVPLGESADDALAYFEKTREKTNVAYDKKKNSMVITLKNKEFYGVIFDKVNLNFQDEKLEEIRLESEDNYVSFNTLIKKLEQGKEYGKAYDVITTDWDVKAKKEFTGQGVVISLELYQSHYTYYSHIYVTISREQ